MNVNIRKDQPEDYFCIFQLIENAFKSEEFSDHKEQFLVERLRNSKAFVHELSLVAEMEDKIVGYILLTNIQIKTSKDLIRLKNRLRSMISVIQSKTYYLCKIQPAIVKTDIKSCELY